MNQPDPTEITAQEKEFKNYELYKKWVRTKGVERFGSFMTWFDPDSDIYKLVVDIGSVEPETRKRISSSKAFVDAFEVGAFLSCIKDNTAHLFYKVKDKAPVFVKYGGSSGVSRVLTIAPAGEQRPDDFSFTVSHYKGRSTSTGAIVPIKEEKISSDMLLLSKAEICHLSYKLTVALNSTFEVQ